MAEKDRLVLVGDRGVAASLSVPAGLRVEPFDGDPSHAQWGVAEVLVPALESRPFPTALLRDAPRLRMIQLLSAGADTWRGSVPSGLVLCTASGAHGAATGEWAVASLLALVRQLPTFVRQQDRGDWGYRMTGSVVGMRIMVIGAGDLGSHVRRRLEALEATVTSVGRRAREGVLGLDEALGLLPHHDAVVLVLPLTPATRSLVDEEFLAAMPDGAVLVNAARGPVVETAALLRELEAGRLRAALDVTDPEPLPPGHPLWDAPGLLLTPHVGSAVPGVRDRVIGIVGDQLARYAAGEAPLNQVGSHGY